MKKERIMLMMNPYNVYFASASREDYTRVNLAGSFALIIFRTLKREAIKI